MMHIKSFCKVRFVYLMFIKGVNPTPPDFTLPHAPLPLPKQFITISYLHYYFN